jgi:DNA-binding transcriptional MerR regulator
MTIPKTIQAAAQASGVSPSTLRVYERLGLVKPFRDSAGRRLYSEADVTEVRRIARERASNRGSGLRQTVVDEAN